MFQNVPQTVLPTEAAAGLPGLSGRLDVAASPPKIGSEFPTISETRII